MQHFASFLRKFKSDLLVRDVRPI